jgi:hypothetical protein
MPSAQVPANIVSTDVSWLSGSAAFDEHGGFLTSTSRVPLRAQDTRSSGSTCEESALILQTLHKDLRPTVAASKCPAPGA